jgi:hypothetical protein
LGGFPGRSVARGVRAARVTVLALVASTDEDPG